MTTKNSAAIQSQIDEINRQLENIYPEGTRIDRRTKAWKQFTELEHQRLNLYSQLMEERNTESELKDLGAMYKMDNVLTQISKLVQSVTEAEWKVLTAELHAKAKTLTMTPTEVNREAFDDLINGMQLLMAYGDMDSTMDGQIWSHWLNEVERQGIMTAWYTLDEAPLDDADHNCERDGHNIRNDSMYDMQGRCVYCGAPEE